MRRGPAARPGPARIPPSGLNSRAATNRRFALSLLRRILGQGESEGGASDRGDTETVRRIASQLERLPREKARYLASFAYVLARVAHADLEIDASEVEEMELCRGRRRRHDLGR